MSVQTPLSQIGTSCSVLLRTLESARDMFGVSKSIAPCGAKILLASRDTPASASAGALVAALCQGGLAEVSESDGEFGGQRLPLVHAKTDSPRLATLTLQSARSFEGVMLSGPIKLYLEQSGEVAYAPDPSRGSLCAVIQAENAPDDAWIVRLADAAGCEPGALTLVVAPQERMLGAAQIAGRMNENMIFTMERSLGLDVSSVASIEGDAPVCPPGAKTKRGKILLPDDFLHYGATAKLTLAPGSGLDAESLARDLAFSSLSVFGGLFIDLLEQAGGDFFKIPDIEHINKLAVVEVFDPDGGQTFRAGELRPDLLR